MASPEYRFTSYDLDQSVDVARAIDQHGGLATADELAVLLKYTSRNNGTFLTRLANARLFGLVDGPSSGLRPSQIAIDILRPDFPATEMRARLQAFESVPLFKAFLDYYHGQALPDESGMRNALENRFKIDADRSNFVLVRLLNSAEQAGLFRVAGNRSKMIRPTVSAAPPPRDPESERPPAPGRTDPKPPPGVGGVRANKIIDGVLDELPEGRQWDEDNFSQWLRFFEDALRIYYKLPRPSTPAERTGAPASNGAGPVHEERGG